MEGRGDGVRGVGEREMGEGERERERGVLNTGIANAVLLFSKV
jgi:hypothetical protein